jgi:hypothetical protein
MEILAMLIVYVLPCLTLKDNVTDVAEMAFLRWF